MGIEPMNSGARRLRTLRAITLFATAIGMGALRTPSALAQTTSATLQGTVRDADRAVLSGATVTLREQHTGLVRTTATDRSGTYVLTNMPAGTYVLTIEFSGFKTLRREGLRFEVGNEATLNATLEVGGVAETVNVVQVAPVVEVSKSTVDHVVSREQIDNLPLTGRVATSLALLSPGVVPGPDSTSEPVTGGGQPRGSGQPLVDGVSNELAATNSVRANAPPDAIQEFQVLTNQYQAEFGNASGIVMNTITRSGTNDLHGRMYFYRRDESFDARNYFATTKATFKQNQPGGWLGGPIKADRTHFFVAYEGTRRTQIATVTSPVEPGDVPQPFDNNQLLAKVTHQISPNHQLNVRFSLDRPNLNNGGVGGIFLEEVGYNERTEDLSFVGSLTSALSSRALNELRLQVSDTHVELNTKNPNAFSISRPTSYSGKLSNLPQTFPEYRVEAVDNLTHEAGTHRFKVGFDINRVKLSGYIYQNVPGVFTFSTDRPFNAADLTTYPVTFVGTIGDPTFSFLSTGISLFAQDAWRLPHDVTLNVGIRYDGWSVTGLDLHKLNVAPRLGFAWDPFGTGKTSIRGGFGIFYNSVLLNDALFTGFLGNQRTVQITNPGYPDPYSRGATANQPPNTYVAQPDQALPRSYQATVGVQREIGTGLLVGVDYVKSLGRDLIRIVDLNPIEPPTFTRPDPTHGFVQQLETTGYSDYNGVLVNVKRQFGTRGLVQAAYTLSRYKTTTEAENSIYQQDDLNKNDSYGYGNYDQRNRAVIAGYWTVPWDIQLGGVLTARSGVPFDITTGRDNNRNGVVNDRPNLAPGAQVNSPDMFNRANFLDPGTQPGNLPRNAGRGFAYWTLDARAAKKFRIGRTSVEGLVEAFNVTNRVNFDNIVGNLASSQFGRPNIAFNPRQVQLGVRFEF